MSIVTGAQYDKNGEEPFFILRSCLYKVPRLD
jgi:hypothetical protein